MTTHTTTVQASTALTSVDALRAELQKSYLAQVKNYFMDEDKAFRFMSSAINVVRSDPKLLGCTRESLLQSLMKIAEYQFYPSNITGEAYILPYNIKGTWIAQFQVGYQGWITLAYRSGVSSLKAVVVYENDFFEMEEGTESKLIHKPCLRGNRGEAYGVYAIAVVNGQKLFTYLSKESVYKFKGFSKSAGTDFSPWNESKDPELTMWKKTAIKQLNKFLPKNSEFAKATKEDDINDSNNAYQVVVPLLENGPAVGNSAH